MNYKNINNIEELNAASKVVRREIKLKKYEIEGRMQYAQEYYTPANFIAAGLNSISSVIPFDIIALKLLRGLRRKLSR